MITCRRPNGGSRRPWRKGPKRDRITITREASLPVDRASLPADAEFKGHEDVVVQDVRFETDNILFHTEK